MGSRSAERTALRARRGSSVTNPCDVQTGDRHASDGTDLREHRLDISAPDARRPAHRRLVPIPAQPDDVGVRTRGRPCLVLGQTAAAPSGWRTATTTPPFSLYTELRPHQELPHAWAVYRHNIWHHVSQGGNNHDKWRLPDKIFRRIRNSRGYLAPKNEFIQTSAATSVHTRSSSSYTISGPTWWSNLPRIRMIRSHIATVQLYSARSSLT